MNGHAMDNLTRSWLQHWYPGGQITAILVPHEKVTYWVLVRSLLNLMGVELCMLQPVGRTSGSSALLLNPFTI
jgi:hypothetical protein